MCVKNVRGGGTISKKRTLHPALNAKKPWTPEDEACLREHWGCKDGVPSIAKMLGRSVNAVKTRARRLKLGAYRLGGDDITFNQLVRTIVGVDVFGCQYTMERWEHNGLPIKRQRMINDYVRRVNIDAFWRWAKNHQDILDFSRFEENALGKEPAWVKEKRKIDQRNRLMATPKKCRWSQQEDALLASMCEAGSYTHEDLQKVFRRTSSSIRRRIYDLALPCPPKGATVKWSVDDMVQLVQMTNAGYGHDYCAKTMNRSAQAVRGKIEWIRKKGLWEEYGNRPLQAGRQGPHEQRARQAARTNH